MMQSTTQAFGCLGNKIRTYSGHYLDLSDPNPEDITIVSIATALSREARFGGHSPEFYSVAEHSAVACKLALADGVSNDAARAVLLHDAAEAFVGDCVKPLKIMLPKYQEIEHRVSQAVAQRFGVDFEKYHDIVEKYDRQMLKLEKLSFWPEDGPWPGFEHIEVPSCTLAILDPKPAAHLFLQTAMELKIV